MSFLQKTNVTTIDAVVNYEAVEQAINSSTLNDKPSAYKAYLAAVKGKSNNEARSIARDILGQSVFWDCDRKFYFPAFNPSQHKFSAS